MRLVIWNIEKRVSRVSVINRNMSCDPFPAYTLAVALLAADITKDTVSDASATRTVCPQESSQSKQIIEVNPKKTVFLHSRKAWVYDFVVFLLHGAVIDFLVDGNTFFKRIRTKLS